MLIVFALLAIGILPLVSIQLRARQDISDSMHRSQANQLALTQIERLRAGGFADAEADSGSSGPFRWKVDVQPDAQSPYLQELQVCVQWVHEGHPRSLSVASKQAAR